MVVVLTLLLLLLKKPIEFLLNDWSADKLKNDFIAGMISRLFLIGFAIYMIRRLQLQHLNGFNPTFQFNNLQALLIPLVIIGLTIFSKINTYQSARLDLLLAFTAAVLVIGFAEELIFRGIILPLFIKMNANKKAGLIISALLSSALFGLIHYINLFREPNNFDGITSQVVFAFSMGMFFAGLFIRVENIVLVALIHGLINFAFGSGQLIETPQDKPVIATDWASLLFALVLYGFVIASGIVMIIFTNQEKVVEKLKDSEKEYVI
ncbi:MAG: lysostaphin resistance A-like protein [Saprospiraceae bacterium]